MKSVLGKGLNRFLGGLLALLGFCGCFVVACRKEYGCPNATFKLTGDVKDAKGKGIEGIRVVFRPDADEEYTWENDTLYSDANGHFEKDRLKHDWPDEARNASVKFEDVDGKANGAFKTKVLTRDELTVEQSREGDGNWYSGIYTIYADAVLEEDNQ